MSAAVGMAARSAVQRHRCYLCGGPLMKRPAKCEQHWRRTVDHVVPQSRGGSDDWSNKLLAHAKCNVAKDNRMPKSCELFYLDTVNMVLGSGLWVWRQNARGQYEYQPTRALARRIKAALTPSLTARKRGEATKD